MLKLIFQKNKKPILIALGAMIILVVVFLVFFLYKNSKISDLKKEGVIGQFILKDFSKQAVLPIMQEKDNYQLTDSLVNGPTITYAKQTEEQKKAKEKEPKNELKIEFPKNYNEPINIKLDDQRIISITDKNGNKFKDKLITDNFPLGIEQNSIEKSNSQIDNPLNLPETQPSIDLPEEKSSQIVNDPAEQVDRPISTQQTSYLKYQDQTKRISTYYAYQKGRERKLKHWTIYENQNENQAGEKETYQVANAKLKLNGKGEVEVYYFGDKELQNQQTAQKVDSDLMDRAQRTLQKELGEDILNNDNHTPDFIIPAPYYINQEQKQVDLNWEINQETNEISVKFNPQKNEYPLALDPTIQFSVPGQAGSGNAISGATDPVDDGLGTILVSGDFNNDGTIDLAVGAYNYASDTGRAYIFYNSAGTFKTAVEKADVVITGENTVDYFSYTMTSGDFNYDGKTDLAVGAYGYYHSGNAGRAYIFYNDGAYPSVASAADVIIDCPSSPNASYFTYGAMTSGDFNNDSRIDLAVGAFYYASGAGRVYIFYNDGTYPTTATSADVIITGEASSRLGASLTTGDFDDDGTTDLAAGAAFYTTNTGRAYIFYCDGSIPTTAATADVIITGEATGNYFGYSVASGDFDNSGTIDLAVGAYAYTSNTGRAYIFYNDGSMPTTAATADVIIAGEATSNYFSYAMVSGDFNYDGRVDLAMGAYNHSSAIGRTYIFYCDGSIPTTAATADVIIMGEAISYFGNALAKGDFNADGKDDLAVGAWAFGGAGRVYIFYNDGAYPTSSTDANIIITGANSTTHFGVSLATGDFNYDGKDDLAVGASYSVTGKVYVFYNDGTYPSTVSGADEIIGGESKTDYFGQTLFSGDFNADGKDDLAVGAYGYSTSTGRAYIFYNDGIYPTTASAADVIITGEANNNYFGYSFAEGDLNNDGRNDLIVGAYGYNPIYGRTYIFYNDGSYPNVAASADIAITGASNYRFGIALATGDFNADGTTDLAVGADNSNYVFIFYNDGSIPTTAATADVKITGESGSHFGYSLVSGDFNADGKMDLAASGFYYASYTGRAYIFYNDSTYPALATDADAIITGETTNNYLGYSMTSGDFNVDGKTDLAVGAYYSSTQAGYVGIFYNDGTYPSSATDADVFITGEYTASYFGSALSGGDFNADGKTDLAVGAYGDNSSDGKIYILYSQNGQIDNLYGLADNSELNQNVGAALASGDFNNDGTIDLAVSSYAYVDFTGRAYIFYNDGSLSQAAGLADVTITGEATGSYFGYTMTSGDFNNDGKTDLVVGAYQASSIAGRAYIFNNDGSYPATAATADVAIAGEAASNYFSRSLGSGDFNNDGKTDLVVGSYGYSSSTGRAYIFYNDGSIPTTAASADLIITGQAASQFGMALISGDFDNSGTMDLAVGGSYYTTNTGRAYIFYNDGSIPTTAATADVTITGETTSNYFGHAMTSGDFDADSKTDLAVGAYGYSTNTGRAYIFYCDGSIPTTAATADVIITGEATGNYFGDSFSSGNFDGDSDTDLAVGANYYSSATGRAYIFYNDGSIPTTAATADVIITGETTNNYFANAMISGDFDGDSDTDLAVTARAYSSTLGRTYIFYNDGSIPTTAATADLNITGDASGNYFGQSMTSGDFNYDGKIDLVVGAYGIGVNTGRIYIFYNDGSMPNSMDTADVIITGEAINNYFGQALIGGDLNYDGKTDLVVGAYGYNTNVGRAYIFYNDGSYPTMASSADVKIDGENSGDYFGNSFSSGDFNTDSRVDLAAGAYKYSTNTGRVYIFYNDGSIPITAATADVTITGGTTNNYFGYSMTSGDFDYDGRIDLAVGAHYYSSYTGRAYIFYCDGSIPASATSADVIITGESGSNYFGYSMTSGDFNSDSRTDLAVGANYNLTNRGAAYIFYNDGSIPTTAATADVKISGETASNLGYSLTSGDFNSDSRTDLAVGATGYNSNIGKAYIFYNDGTYPSAVADADVIIFSKVIASNTYFGCAMVSGDFDGNNRIDLSVGLKGVSNLGGFYIYTVDAEGTKPNYVKIKESIRIKGGVRIK
ncbi:MAG: FG-GAP-like repeat-containing protein [Parcubacteria group bacterium]|jgi:hypothetical protein